jgi:glycerate kinase
VRVVVAPDKFKGTLTAEQAAEAIATGWGRGRPADELITIPMADGGEGTLEALVAALGWEVRPVRVTGPLGDPTEAAFGRLRRHGRGTAIVELARASGLQLVGPARRDAMRATTRGTGEVLLAALREGVDEVILGIGGSASTDGGAGIAVALGAALLDASGRPIREGGSGLLDLDRIDASSLDPSLRGVRIQAACDVDSPLTGPAGAAHVFGPQKGASPVDVVVLDRALAHFAAVIHRDLGIDVRGLPGGGAAGGAGAGLVAFCGAHLRPGVDVVIEAVGLPELVADADLVLTGEGRLDASSLRGKVPAGVLELARRARVPAGVLCGRAEIAPEGVWVTSLIDRVGEERALGDARRALVDVAAEAAAGLPVSFPP